MYRFKFDLLIMAMLCLNAVCAQTGSIENLRRQVTKAKSGEAKLQALLLLAEQWNNMPLDSVLAVSSSIAWQASNNKNELGARYANFYKAGYYAKLGLFDSARALVSADTIWLRQHWKASWPLWVLSKRLLATIAIRSKNNTEAQRHMFELLAESEKQQDVPGQLAAMTNIGWSCMELGLHHQAKNWFLKTLALIRPKIDTVWFSVLYNNLSSTYNALNNTDSAMYWIEKAVAIAKQQEALSNLCNSFSIKSSIHLKLLQKDLARQSVEEALVTRRKIGDPFYLASDLGQLAFFYAQYGPVAKGIACANEGIDVAIENNFISKLPFLYEALAANYKSASNYIAYATTLEKLIASKDSFYIASNADALALLNAKYAITSKDNIILNQQLAIAKRDYRIAVLAGLLLALFFVGILAYQYYRRLQSNRLAQVLHEAKAIRVDAVSKAEEAQRRKIAAELHDNMGAQLSFIKSNVDWILDAPVPQTEIAQMERLQKVHQTSSELMLSLRETLWALNRESISFDELKDKLTTYLRTLVPLKPDIALAVYESIHHHHVLSPLEALNLFRIFQESANNALKHSKATKLQLDATTTVTGWRISLTDNGIGFETHTVAGEHYGLSNMRNRANEVHFVFKVDSCLNIGTTITCCSIKYE